MVALVHKLLTLCERALANPYTAPAQAASERLLEEGQASLSDWSLSGRRVDAHRLACGLVLSSVRRGRAKSPLASLGAKALAGLPHARGDYERWAHAVRRAESVLQSLHGQSQPVTTLRVEVWNACFGSSFEGAIELGEVIRDHDVLILGETGTGKESVARALQQALPSEKGNRAAPSAAVNAAAVPESLVESELFGHIKGAFTGANDDRAGRIRAAHGGCFFLDEVGDLPASTQAKLLRVMETDEVTPVGSDRPLAARVRYVAATHRELPSLVDQGKFRRDLLLRLAGTTIRVPPLRDRTGDIATIAEAFLASYQVTAARADTVRVFVASDEAQKHDWPGNVRELHNALRNVLLGLDPGLSAPAATGPVHLPDEVAEARASWKQVEDWYLAQVLRRCDGNYTAAARLLGADRSTVRRRARKMGL